MSYSHGDQKCGKADQWPAYLEKNNTKNLIISFLHRRFNAAFLLGGGFYLHREHITEFLKSMESQNWLRSSVKQDVKGLRYNGER